MKKNTEIAVLLCTIVYSILFYDQYAGINFLIFTLAILLSYFIVDRKSFQNKTVFTISFAALFSSIFVMIYGADMAIWATIISLLLIPGIAGSSRASVLLNIIFALYSILTAPILDCIKFFKTKNETTKPKTKGLLVILVPLIFGILFFLIYQNINPLFKKYTEAISLDFISFSWIMFTIGGFFLIYPIFHHKRINRLDEFEKNIPLNMNGSGIIYPKWNEQTTYVILFVFLNLMLLFINALDLNYLYLGAGMPENLTHKQFVHKGVNMLILSILLGIILLLFFFRGTLNYTKGIRFMQLLAGVWLIQNAFMVVSTAIRNIMYVNEALLTYKRIGVFFWLLFALIGLSLTYIKIKKKKTAWYLLKMNITIAFAVFIVSSAFDWDSIISKFNISRMHQVTNISAFDKNYLLSLSEGNTSELYRIRNNTGFEVDSAYSYLPDYYSSNKNWLDHKIYRLLKREAKNDWRSFSFRSNRAFKRLMKVNELDPITNMNLSGYHRIKSLKPLTVLPYLDTLNLSASGIINFQELNLFKQLKHLNVSHNFIQDHELDSLTLNDNLTHLNASDNLLEGLNFLNNYPSLEVLDLNTNKLFLLKSMPSLNQLKILKMGRNPLKNIDGLKDCQKLEELHLDHLTETFNSVPYMPNLRMLNLTGSTNTMGAFQNILSKTPSLKQLNISQNSLQNLQFLFPDFEHDQRTNIEELNISSNQLYSLTGLDHFYSLHELYANDNRLFNPYQINNFLQLQKLFLSNNQLENIDFLEGLNNIEKLDLSYNSKIENFNTVSGLTKLVYLNLSGTKFSELGEIRSYKTLKELRLYNCELNSMQDLQLFKHLETLSISFLKESDIKTLITLPNLKVVYIDGTEQKVLDELKQTIKEKGISLEVK